MKKESFIRIKHIIYLIFFIILDQVVKAWARGSLSGGHDIILIQKVLRFTYVENTGSAFGLFKGQTVPVTIFGILLLSAIIWVYVKIPKTKRFMPLNLITVFITAGALGNIIDRILYGFVTDFIYFEPINFPVFNIADIYITTSGVLLIILTCFYYKEDELTFLSKKEKKES